MKKNINKYIAVMLAMFILIGSSGSVSEAASKHLLIINTKKNTIGYYVNNKFVKQFKVATGKSSTPTPTGKTTIVNKIKNRPYYSGLIPGGDPRNPLGDRWMGLYLKGTFGTTYAIHGNNNESSIGKHVSGGCIRMHNTEVRWLFDQITVGTDVILKSTDEIDEQIAAGYNIKLNQNKPGWKKENSKWYYIKEDRNYQKNGWLKIQGKYYYFDKDGVMQIGWKKVESKWYYLESNGMMATGWKKVEGKWYYLESNGMMATGWKKVEGKWYYLESNGMMATGWKKVEGKWYYLESNGMIATGWKKIEGKWYYLESNGMIATGWKKLEGKWYYFNQDGNMVTNTTIDGWLIDGDGVGTQQYNDN